MDRERVLKLVGMLKASGATELEVEREGLRVTVRLAALAAPPGPVETVEAQEQPSYDGSQAISATGQGVLVHARVVGFFRRSRKEGGAPLAEPGQQVKAGQPICAIEALSRWIMVESPLDGEIAEFLLEDGQRADYGTALVRLRPVP
ncbi:MAG: acetyl-CoA carboxylase biotin carboxyl carrier protein subunit [Armatimonadota bacterium]